MVYDGYLSNAEDDPEGASPVIIKTVKGKSGQRKEGVEGRGEERRMEGRGEERRGVARGGERGREGGES